jgi:hypothetical protein
MALSVIIDVGNSSVGAALVMPTDRSSAKNAQLTKERATIIASRRLFLPLTQELAAADLERSLISTLRDLLDVTAVDVQAAITHRMASRLDAVYCVLASPWIEVVPHVETIERTVPFTISERLVSQTLSEYLAAYTKKQTDVSVCDSRITSILLNGYEVAEPFGMSTHKVTMGAVLSVMPTALKQQLQTMIARKLHPHTTHFHAFSLTAFDALRDLFPHQSDWIFADISGEVTELLHVKHGVITNTNSIPQGWHALIRAVAQKMHTTPDVARSLVAMAVRDATHDHTSEKVRLAIEPVLKQWVNTVAPATGEIHGLRAPIYLTADDDVGPLYQATMTALVAGSSVQVIERELMQPFVALGTGARYDTFIALAALAVTKS